ncbi:MAG: histidine phosphatase family protein [Deltaproteobacteria bacterium]|nr:histidine phosphatase family protein [Deltaproteobacteria bacterium]
MELLLIRHALPLRVEKEDGSPADPGLSETGIDQARRLARWMESEQLEAIYSSPLNRARMTAQFLAEVKGIEIHIEPGIAEFDNQSSVYVPMEELRAKDYEQWLKLVSGGFEERYNLKDFRKVAVTSIETIIAQNSGRRVAVVCHGGIINIWAAHVLRIDKFLFFAPEYTSINRFLASGKGQRSVASLNETAHLRENLTLI